MRQICLHAFSYSQKIGLAWAIFLYNVQITQHAQYCEQYLRKLLHFSSELPIIVGTLSFSMIAKVFDKIKYMPLRKFDKIPIGIPIGKIPIGIPIGKIPIGILSEILIGIFPIGIFPIGIPIGIPIGTIPIGSFPTGIPIGKIPIGIFPTGIPIEI